MTRLMLSFLGAIETKLDEEPITGLKTDKVRALLVNLAVERERPHRRQSLAGLLWPDFPETKARTNLRHALANLRKSLGEDHNQPPYILVERETIHFNPESDFWLDVAELEEVAADSESTIEAAESAIAHYRGPFLDGFSLRDSPEFDNWTAINRERYQVMFSDTVIKLVGDFERRNDLKNAILYARRRLEVEPWEEAAHRQLMRLLTLSGQRSAALAQFEACRQGLAEELGVEPSAETTQLYEQIRDGEIVAKERGHRRGVLPVRLTSFIGREVEIDQVIALLGSHRMVTVTGPGGIGKTRLGLQVAGRLEDQYRNSAWWVELAPLADPELVPETVVRVLGLHLESRQIALDSLRFFLEERHLLLLLDNCEHLVEACATLADALLRACPELSILATSREALGIKGECIYSLPPMDLPDVAEPQVLDGLVEFESIRLFTERAKDVSPDFVTSTENIQTLIRICRQVDGIPLAIELAAARVRMMGVETIAKRLGDRFQLLTGGSRTALPRQQTLRGCIDWSYELLTEEEHILLQRLSVFAGRWTLEAAEYVGCGDGIESNQVLDLLGELVDKSLVTTDNDPDVGTHYRMLETIRQYAHEKLVKARGLEATRDRHLQYYMELAERLEKVIRGPEQGVVLRRLETELENIRLSFNWSIQDKDEKNWKIEWGMRLGAALHWFWYLRARDEEGYNWLKQLLDRRVERRPGLYREVSALQAAKLVRAKTLMTASRLSRSTGKTTFADLATESRDLYLELGSKGRLGYARTIYLMAIYDLYDGKLHQADEYLRESLAILQESGDKFWQSQVLVLMGALASVNQEFSHAISYFESALALSREIGDLDGIAYHLYMLAGAMMEQTLALDHEIIEYIRDLAIESLKIFMKGENILNAYLPMLLLGDLEWRQGDYQRASKYFNQALSHGETNGELRTVNFSLSRLASLALSQGEYQQAGDLFNQKMKINLKWNHKLYIANSLLNLGDLDWVLGEYEQAISKYKTALKMFREDNRKRGEAISLFCLGRISLLQGEFRLARGYLDEAIKLSKNFDMKDWENIMIEVFAKMASIENESERAARLLGATAAWYATWQRTRWLNERNEREQVITAVRQALGEDVFTTAWEEGVAMTLDEAIAYALEGDVGT